MRHFVRHSPSAFQWVRQHWEQRHLGCHQSLIQRPKIWGLVAEHGKITHLPRTRNRILNGLKLILFEGIHKIVISVRSKAPWSGQWIPNCILIVRLLERDSIQINLEYVLNLTNPSGFISIVFSILSDAAYFDHRSRDKGGARECTVSLESARERVTESWKNDPTNRIWMQVSAHVSCIFNNHCTHS